jgi:hypothetical protein
LIKSGRDIFKSSFWQKLRSLDGLIDEKYPNERLEQLFLEKFKDCQLSELLKPCLISSYEIERRKAHFFDRIDAQKIQQKTILLKISPEPHRPLPPILRLLKSTL